MLINNASDRILLWRGKDSNYFLIIKHLKMDFLRENGGEDGEVVSGRGWKAEQIFF